MIPKNLLRTIVIAAVVIVAISFFSYAKNHMQPAECSQKDGKNCEEGNSKGDLFIWESITRNLASLK